MSACSTKKIIMSNRRSKKNVPMDRRYGFFRCISCGKAWESSHVYCKKDTKKVLFRQDCKACGTACNPKRVEYIRCSMCGLTDCICDEEDLDLKHHINPNKPHLARLCHKCRAGIPCNNDSDGYDSY